MDGGPLVSFRTPDSGSGFGARSTLVAARLVLILRGVVARAALAPPRRWVIAGLVLAIGLSLWTSVDLVPISSGQIEFQMNAHGDFYRIYASASKASLRDVPRWFAGSWIYEGCGYYRPLTSVLFYVERHVFNRNFTAYNALTWLLHGLNSGLLYLLVVSLLRAHPRTRALYGLIAVWFFATPANSMHFAVEASIQWWPAQNDPFSLVFGLTCLILLDRYLLTPRRGLLIGSVVAMVCAIGAKEAGHFTMPLALALIVFRRGSNLRAHWMEMLAFAVPSVALFFFRRLVVPNHWEPDMWRLHSVVRAARYFGGPAFIQAKVGEWWVIAAAIAILATIAWGVRRRSRAWKVIALCLLETALCAQFLKEDGAWALVFDYITQISLVKMLVYGGSLFLFWLYRRSEPGILAAAWILAISVSVMGYVGYHYYYWPSAILSVADAVFAACLVRAVWENLIQPNRIVIRGYVYRNQSQKRATTVFIGRR